MKSIAQGQAGGKKATTDNIVDLPQITIIITPCASRKHRPN